MLVELQAFSNPTNYNSDYPSRTELMPSTTAAIEFARKQIAKVRGTDKYLAYKIVTVRGDLKYKLPCY